MPLFDRFIGIDYSGAQTPESSLKGLRVYMANGGLPAGEVPPPPSPRKYWTRRGIAEWLVERLSEKQPTLVGIDHGFSFPLKYFDAYHLDYNWPLFLDDFQRHWPTDGKHMYVDFVRDGIRGAGAFREGKSRWRRLAEKRTGSAKSVFHFDVPGSVAKSTHAGLPWLRYLRQHLGDRIHFSFGQIYFNAPDTLKEVMANQDTSACSRMGCPPSNTKNSFIKIIKDSCVEEANLRCFNSYSL